MMHYAILFSAACAVAAGALIASATGDSVAPAGAATGPASAPASSSAPAFALPARWELSAPLISPAARPEDPYVAVKDPSVVYDQGKWHVFMTIRPVATRTPMEYLSFDKWENADKAHRTVLAVHENFYCAPQVFYFEPQKKWYLIYQVGGAGRKFGNQVAYSTTQTLADPASWTKAKLLFPTDDVDHRAIAGLDYWIICDSKRAYLFFTSLNGKLWRMWTDIKDFPAGFDHCELALEADIFEASHTYRLKGMDKYLTFVEAGQEGKRYFKAYLADTLDGKWTPLADTREKPFAGEANVVPAKGVAPWADNISHGELLRDSNDQTMTVDPANLRLVIQGVLEKDKADKKYGQIPWRIGMLTPKSYNEPQNIEH